MAFGREKLDVYRAAIEYVGWGCRFCEALAGHHAKEMLAKPGQRGYAVHEAPGEYRTAEIDPNTDTDHDPERSNDRQPPATGGRRRNTAPPPGRWQGMILGLVLVSLMASAARGDEWLRTVKIAVEKPDDGQQIFNICLTPNKSVAYDQLIFECVYKQEIPWQDAKGRRQTKVPEPVFFTYRRAPAKLVADLDCNISFRVPVSYERLSQMFAEHTFATNAPITVDRIRIFGERGDARLWEQDFKVPGTYTIEAQKPKPPPPPPPKSKRFGDIDLDK